MGLYKGIFLHYTINTYITLFHTITRMCTKFSTVFLAHICSLFKSSHRFTIFLNSTASTCTPTLYSIKTTCKQLLQFYLHIYYDSLRYYVLMHKDCLWCSRYVHIDSMKYRKFSTSMSTNNFSIYQACEYL